MVPPSVKNAEVALHHFRDEAVRVIENKGGEPRWPAAITLCVAGIMNFALPSSLRVGPVWLMPAVIALLLIPTAWTHRQREHYWNNFFGYIVNGATTLFLLWSVALLVITLPANKEGPIRLLAAAGVLWFTNVIVFALWYWRIDAGGPNQRDRRDRHTCGSFLFPQMTLSDDVAQISGIENWSPNFWDYLFLAFNHSTALSPTDTAVLSRWAKLLAMGQAFISMVIIVLLAARAINTLQ